MKCLKCTNNAQHGSNYCAPCWADLLAKSRGPNPYEKDDAIRAHVYGFAVGIVFGYFIGAYFIGL
jgi:hypothetical protein